MSGRLPWFRCRPAPLLGEIAGMQADEGYVYLVLFLRIFETGGPVSETSRTLARRTGLREQKIVAALESLLEVGKLQRLSDGRLDIASTHEEIDWQNERRDEQSKAGKTSAKKRTQIHSDPLTNWEQAKGLLLALRREDQDDCSRLAARYLGFCRRTGSPVVSPSQWIKGRGWIGFLKAECRATRQLKAKTTPVWIVEDTAAWAAWKRHRESTGRSMPSPESIRSERGYGWWFPASFPSDAKTPRSRQVRDRS